MHANKWFGQSSRLTGLVLVPLPGLNDDDNDEKRESGKNIDLYLYVLNNNTV